ncbi:MAG: hypothetical protein J5610_03100 [Prevotella sp.]|nr:hypothetical protein [Prevotella sp.]
MKKYISPETQVVIIRSNTILIGASGGGTNDVGNGGESAGGMEADAKDVTFGGVNLWDEE